MSLKVAALYQFVPLPDFRALREPLRARLSDLGVKGTLLLARGTEITEPVLRWFANRRSDLRLPIRVVLPAVDNPDLASSSADDRSAAMSRAV